MKVSQYHLNLNPADLINYPEPSRSDLEWLEELDTNPEVDWEVSDEPSYCPCCGDMHCACRMVDTDYETGVVAPDGYRERRSGTFCEVHRVQV